MDTELKPGFARARRHERPVPARARVVVQRRDGKIESGFAGDFNWGMQMKAWREIIGYRIIKTKEKIGNMVAVEICAEALFNEYYPHGDGIVHSYKEAEESHKQNLRRNVTTVLTAAGVKYNSAVIDLGILMREQAAGIRTVGEVRADLLEEAQIKLKDMKPELERTKIEEWQAAYAGLFNLLNPVMEENSNFRDTIAVLRGALLCIQSCAPEDLKPLFDEYIEFAANKIYPEGSSNV